MNTKNETTDVYIYPRYIMRVFLFFCYTRYDVNTIKKKIWNVRAANNKQDVFVF